MGKKESLLQFFDVMFSTLPLFTCHSWSKSMYTTFRIKRKEVHSSLLQDSQPFLDLF